METEKPPCEYGAKCYRKNPKHFESYSHPDKLNVNENVIERSEKNFGKKDEKNKVRMKQTTLQFTKNWDFTMTNAKTTEIKQHKKTEPDSSGNKKKLCDRGQKNSPFKRRRKNLESENKRKVVVHNKKARTTNCFKTSDSDDLGDANSKSSEDGDVPSTSWVFTKNNSTETEKSPSNVPDFKNKTVEEIIKILFLVDMPSDFYSFYEFCKSFDESNLKTLHLGDLKLVGPFDVLSGEINHSLDQDLYLCHWRFYYDPPEFQTVLVAESGFHIGYWRDDPKENPVFLASNNPNKDCVFKIEAENIFGAVFHYLSEFMKTCDPFKKVKIGKLQTALSEWAEKNEFSLEKKTNKMKARQKKVVSNTFHSAGIVVPVEAKTELGYRPLIETDANLKKICKSIMKASDESEKESLWENLQPLITAANIANDECDFGNSLELGIDLFCMGSPVFHETVEHLLSTAYTLLNRTEFEKILKAHLKFRRKSNHLSVNN